MYTVNVKLTNRWATFVGQYPHKLLIQFFRYHPNNYIWMPKYKQGVWDGYISLLRYNKVGAGLFLAQAAEIERRAAVRFQVEDLRHQLNFLPYTPHPEDRAYQLDGVEQMIAASSVGGIVLNATGTGKTRIAGILLSRLVGNGVFVVDELTLLDQAKNEIQQTLMRSYTEKLVPVQGLASPNGTNEPLGSLLEQITRVGVIGEGIFAPERITVATIQTLFLHHKDFHFGPWMRSLDVAIIDEFHTALNNRTFTTMRGLIPAAIYGLTATLELKKAYVRLPAYAIAGPVIYEYPLERGVKEGVLTAGIVVSLAVAQRGLADITGKKENHPSQYRYLVVSSDKRNTVIANIAAAAYNAGKHVVVIAERVAHIKNLSQLLRRIPHRVIWGGVKTMERVRAKKDFDASNLRLLIVNKVFKKGVDIKKIDVIIECSAMKSKNDAIQKYGRGVRLAANKQGLLYFDISDISLKKDLPKRHPHNNPLQKATKSRLRAYKSRNLKVFTVKVDADTDMTLLMRRAQRTLDAQIENPGGLPGIGKNPQAIGAYGTANSG